MFASNPDAMSQMIAINPRIIEGLYCEALVLADEVRDAFDMSRRDLSVLVDDDFSRVALSCEALRTTTRTMHALAWLLNHRAFCMGELSEFQLRRHSRMSADYPQAEPDRVVLLTPDIRALIAMTERFYARLVRLDRDWHRFDPAAPSAVSRLRDRLTQSVGLAS